MTVPPHAPLLRELVLALLGDFGDTFVVTPATDAAACRPPAVVLAPRVAAWLPRPDAVTLTRLAAAGAAAAALDDAACAGTDPAGTAAPAARALAAGVDAFLNDWRSAVLALEQRILQPSSPPPSLAEVELALGEWPALLPAVAGVVAQCVGARAADAAATLSRATRCGWPALEDAAAALAGRVAAAHVAALEAWCVDGVLADAEFFVAPGSDAAATTARPLPLPSPTPAASDNDEGGYASAASDWSSDDGEDEGDADGPAWSDDDDGGGGGTAPRPSTATARRRARLSRAAAAAAAASAEWAAGFDITLTDLPPHVPLAAARDALFAGRAARALTRCALPRAAALAAAADAAADRAVLRGLLGADLTAPVAPRPADVAAALGSVRARADVRLWSAAGGAPGLRSAVTALADFALMRDGALWDSFARDAYELMGGSGGGGGGGEIAPAAADAALASALASTALAVGRALPGPPLRLRLAYNASLDGGGGSWDGRVGVAAAVGWPLAAALPSDLLTAADAAFRTLLRVKRAMVALDLAFVCLRRAPSDVDASDGRGSLTPAVDAAWRGLWRAAAAARAALAAVGAYLADDVVGPAVADLDAALKAAETTAAGGAAAADAAAALAGGFLAWDPTTSSLLAALASACHRLAAVAAASPPDLAAVEALGGDVARRVALLKDAVAAVAGGGGAARAPRARTLVLRLGG